MMYPQKPFSDVDFKIAKVRDNERSKAEFTIMIIPGQGEIYETPQNFTVDMNENNPCPSLIDVDKKAYTNMRQYKTINVEKAICFMNRWVKRLNSNGGENGGQTPREEINQVKGFKCDQGGSSRNSFQGPPAIFPKPISVKHNCSCDINSKFRETAAYQSLPSRCDQTSKSLLIAQNPKEFLGKPQHYHCVPITSMLESCTFTPVKAPLSTESENASDIRQDKNENPSEDNNPKLVKNQLKTKKDSKTKRSSKSSTNSNESKIFSNGKNNKISENGKIPKQSKSKSSKTKASPTNSISMVSQYSQTSLDDNPNELYRQQYNNDSNQSSTAEITAYLGKSSIKKRCDPSIVEQLLISLFGSQFSDIDGIEIRKIRKEDCSCFTDWDQSKVTVESCHWQAELQDCRNDVAHFCNESKEVATNVHTSRDEEEWSPQCITTNTVHHDSNSADDCHAQIGSSGSFEMQRPQQCLHSNEQFIEPLKCHMYGRCVNCGLNKISQKQEYN